MMLSRLGYQVLWVYIPLCLGAGFTMGVNCARAATVIWCVFYCMCIQQYHAKFQREGVTILELPHITEEQLIHMGIPLGPRQRILDEIQKL